MIRIRRAGPADLKGILGLLEAAGLPGEGVEEHLARFLVAEEDGRLLATAGLEMGEACALLRSVAVEPSARGTGLGIEIVRQALRFARSAGAREVYLLTESADSFFLRFGFGPALRAEIEALFPRSSQTRQGGSCASAKTMVLRDLSRVTAPMPRP